MIEKFISILHREQICPEEDEIIVAYGLGLIIEICLNIATTVVIGLILGKVLESAAFLISFAYLRTYAGGYHLSNRFFCYIGSTIIVALVLIQSVYIPLIMQRHLIFIELAFALVCIFILAPIPAVKKPLSKLEKEAYRKKAIFRAIALGAIACGFFKLQLITIAFVIVNALLVTALLVLMGFLINNVRK